MSDLNIGIIVGIIATILTEVSLVVGWICCQPPRDYLFEPPKSEPPLTRPPPPPPKKYESSIVILRRIELAINERADFDGRWKAKEYGHPLPPKATCDPTLPNLDMETEWIGDAP